MTKLGEPLPINGALNRPRTKLGLELSAWMAARKAISGLIPQDHGCQSQTREFHDLSQLTHATYLEGHAQSPSIHCFGECDRSPPNIYDPVRFRRSNNRPCNINRSFPHIRDHGGRTQLQTRMRTDLGKPFSLRIEGDLCC